MTTNQKKNLDGHATLPFEEWCDIYTPREKEAIFKRSKAKVDERPERVTTDSNDRPASRKYLALSMCITLSMQIHALIIPINAHSCQYITCNNL